MRYITGIAIGYMVCLMASGCQRPEPPVSSPDVVYFADGNVQHLGVLKGGTVVQRSFVLKNPSDTPVVLSDRLQTSCGCTSAILTSPVVEPHGETQLVVDISVPRAFTEDEWVTIIGQTLEPKQSPFALRVLFDSYMPWTIRPAEIRLKGYPGDELQDVVHVVRSGDVAVTLTQTEADRKWLRVSTPSGFDEDGHATITLTCACPQTPGIYDGNVTVHAEDVDISEQEIAVSLLVEPRFQAIPNELFIKDDQGVARVRRTVSIIGETPFFIENVESDSAVVQAEPCDTHLATEHRVAVVAILHADDLAERQEISPGSEIVRFTLDTQRGRVVVELPVHVVY